MKFLLDTCVVSELVASHPNPALIRWLNETDEAALYLSVITIGEIQKGIAKLPPSKRKQELHAWFKGPFLTRFHGKILPLEMSVLQQWGEFCAWAENNGRNMPALDSLIAALALTHNLILVTRNVKDFAGTPVRLLNPWE